MYSVLIALEDTVGLHSFTWGREHVPAISSSGATYYRYAITGMPKIHDDLLNVAFYLYKSREDAEKGEKYGGTGFIISLSCEADPSQCVLFGVTNWHVAVRDGFSVIRFTNKDNTLDIREYDPSEWIFDPKFDIAVIGINNTKNLQVKQITDDSLITRNFDIGVGDEVFMLGRFINHDGVATTKPAARFGNISIMPAPIMQSNGKEADSFCIDMHSRSGFSGSPVIVYAAGNDLQIFLGNKPVKRKAFVRLLGIHWGQFPEEWTVEDGEVKAVTHANDEIEGKYIKGLSGMTCVLPAWSIMEVFEKDEVKEIMKQANDDIRREQRENPQDKPIAESTHNEAGGPSAQTQSGDALLEKMLNTPPQHEQEKR